MRKDQRGVAVIVAMLIVLLAASTAAFAVWQQSLWVRQLENISDRAKADQLATSALDVARDVLKRDDPQSDDLSEAWAAGLTLPAENAVIDGKMVDQQGRFNLNNLVRQNDEPSAPDKAAFARLLKELELPVELADAVTDWIRTDQAGMTDLYYLSLTPPYRAAQRKLMDIGELARVKGFNEDFLRILSPYVTALDTATAVNVNTASAEVIAAVLDGLSPSDAKTLVKQRESKPFKTQQEFKDKLPSTVTCGPKDCYDVKSNYFTATVRVTSGRVESGYTALLKRAGTGWPVILWRKDAAD